jgi:hypothetical protein
MSKYERWVPPSCEWCGCEFESESEMERHRCRHAGDAGLGVDAPSDWSDSRVRPFPWRRGELDGIGRSSWKKGKK